MKKQLFGAINKQGTEFIPLVYNSVKRYAPDSSLFIVQNKEGKFGIYDKLGKPRIPEYFVKITDYQNFEGRNLAEIYRVPGEVFFYINEEAKCVEYNGKVCPEE